MKFKLIVKEKPEAITVGKCRYLFENIIKATPSLAKEVDLEPDLGEGGKFDGYVDQTTNSLWVGFAMGLRWAERILEKEFL